MGFKAYIIPLVGTGDFFRTQVVRTEYFARLIAGESKSNVGYLLKGERKEIPDNCFPGKHVKKFNYKNAQDFYNSIRKHFTPEGDVSEGNVEKFAQENDLIPTKLVFG